MIPLAWATDNTRWSWPEGSPSGKPLGQKSWQGGGGTDYVLQVHDGPSIFNLTLNAKINTVPGRGPVWKPITKSDQVLCEHIARVMLKRLRTLKLTHDTYKPS